MDSKAHVSVLTAVLAAIAALAIGVGAVSHAGAVGGPLAGAAKGKKCKGKKGKKGAVVAKKCKGKKKGSGNGNGGGPEIAVGEYFCQYGSFQVQPGNRYTVNRTDPGTYTYNPSLGIVNFHGGSYASFFGRYHPNVRTIELYSAVNDPPVEIGDYGWSCSL